MNRPLTRKQRLFIDFYCSAAVRMNATEAARRAGYQGNDNTLGTVAFQNMQKPAIREEIDKRLKAASSATQITIEKVLRDLEEVRGLALSTKKYSAAIRCIELQGKYLGMWSDKIDRPQMIDDMSTEKLVELLREVIELGGLDIAELLSANGVAKN